MKRKTEDYSWKLVPQSEVSPCDRFKHACCICRGFLYIYGGRQNSRLSDFWRYRLSSGSLIPEEKQLEEGSITPSCGRVLFSNLHVVAARDGSHEWERLQNSEDGPEDLEEHTMVDYQGVLYIFGGMVDSVFTQKTTPLWMYDTDSTRWTGYRCQLTAVEAERTVPVNRKGHSAVVYRGNMFIYGGYIDIKGSSQEFWSLCFNTKEWTQLPTAPNGGSPGPRHGHSAVVYNSSMYLFGGLMGLSEQKDFWKWEFGAGNWSCIRKSQGPPKVVGHSATVFEDSMLVFGGGIPNTSPCSALWKFHFPSQTWKKVANPSPPSSKAFHCVLGIGCGFCCAADSPGMSLTSMHGKKTSCSKLLSFSKRHTCFFDCHPLETGYRTFSNEAGTEIEMKPFRLSQEQSGISLFQTTTNAELSEGQEKSLQLRQAEDFGGRKDWSCFFGSGLVDMNEPPPALLLLGGKPLSGSSSITFWQMDLDKF